MAIREFTVKAAADAGKLLFHRMSGREQLGLPFRYELEVLSERDDLALVDLLGTGMTVTITRLDGSRRHLHGLVARAEFRGTDGPFARYGVVLVPWLWFLGRRQDCRIFQAKDTPTILREVLEGWPVADFAIELEGSYRPRDYCVQYRESDLDFVSRLAEDEGITFFFRHREDGHTLVLIDGPGPCAAVPGYAEIPYFPPRERARRERDHVDLFQASVEVRAGKTALKDFDFEKPKADLTARDADPRAHPLAEAEIYDYPGNYRELAAGDAIVRLRLEEELAPHARAVGAGNASGLACGARFDLVGSPRKEENRTWLVLAAELELSSEAYRTAMGEPEGEPLRCRFEVLDLAVPYRPPRRTPKPIVRGPQTAIVTGPAGEEIHCDQYGRIKVQFHWDRLGKRDQESSCWLRVSQAWAGTGFGAIHIPRIGQEVIVDFLEGDPDRPIVTGRVYNALATVPYGLPGNATQSGIKSNSSKGGGGSNELRFEDKKGGEQVWLHAQKNEDIVVENDKTEHVKHDETITIGNDRTESVGHDETLSVGNDRTRDVGAHESVAIGATQSITVGTDQTIKVGASQSETVGTSRTDSVGTNEVRSVGSNQQQTVGAARTVTVGAAQAHQIGANDGWTVGGARSATIAKDETLQVGGGRSTTIGKDDSLEVAKNLVVQVGDNVQLTAGKDGTVTIGKNLAVTAGDSIEIKTGSAMIIMKKDGSITIKGKDILIQGSGKIDIKSDKNITMKGQKILQN